MGKTVYIAARFEARAALRIFAHVMTERGYRVLSKWLNAPPESSLDNPEAPREDLAIRDLGEILSSQVFILDTIEVSDRGGREVELGIALASRVPEIYLVGPRRNVFHYHPRVHVFSSWLALLAHLEVPRAANKIGTPLYPPVPPPGAGSPGAGAAAYGSGRTPCCPSCPHK